MQQHGVTLNNGRDIIVDQGEHRISADPTARCFSATYTYEAAHLNIPHRSLTIIHWSDQVCFWSITVGRAGPRHCLTSSCTNTAAPIHHLYAAETVRYPAALSLSATVLFLGNTLPVPAVPDSLFSPARSIASRLKCPPTTGLAMK